VICVASFIQCFKIKYKKQTHGETMLTFVSFNEDGLHVCRPQILKMFVDPKS
jgi:hypothetical protein